MTHTLTEDENGTLEERTTEDGAFFRERLFEDGRYILEEKIEEKKLHAWIVYQVVVWEKNLSGRGFRLMDGEGCRRDFKIEDYDNHTAMLTALGRYGQRVGRELKSKYFPNHADRD
jgi:hypothetical protein